MSWCMTISLHRNNITVGRVCIIVDTYYSLIKFWMQNVRKFNFETTDTDV
jgi:hypothetical protein